MREEPILEVPEHIKALPEPEQGPALVEAIHRRKDVREAVQYFTANRITMAQLGPDGEPLNGADIINGFVDGLRATIEEEDGASQAQYTRRLNGPSSLQVWIDEAQEWRDAHAPSEWDEVFNDKGQLTKVSASVEMTWTDVSHDFMAIMLGYGSAEEMRKEEAKRRHLWNQVDDMLMRPVDAPPVGSVRWACKRPTDPVYPKYSNGWLLEQYEARITPQMREHNRKIAKENAAIIDRFAQALGVKRNDSRD